MIEHILLFLTAVADFFFVSWLFWPLICIAGFFSMMLFSDIKREKEFHPGALFCVALALFALWYRYPAARFSDWHTYVYLVGGYIVAGFGMALYQWFSVLYDFRKSDVANVIAETKQNLKVGRDIRRTADEDLRDCLRQTYRTHIVEVDPKTRAVAIRPDWKMYPIAIWWTYWPFFITDIVIDPLTRLLKRLTDILKQFWDSLARHFEVKG